MPSTDPITEFRQNLANALAKAAQSESIHRTDAANIAATLGISIVSWEGDGNPVLAVPAVKVSETVNGVPRSDLTAEAIARYEARELHKIRRAAYDRLHRAVRYEEMSEEAAIAVCEATGLPVPVTKTSVEYNVTGFGYGAFTVSGELTEEEVREKLLPLASDPKSDKIRELFGSGAEGVSDGIEALYVNQLRTWPSFPPSTEPDAS